ncbi:ATP-binding cassette domain-containing protein [Desulfuromonas carbonis]|uniref:ATP-binding cassette domain-containing protein n=1 Tax=Desulfuromonas sp. DDH964 TaxID=1823759 RepID=UPI00078C8ED7|nr:ATP-binding cassette domain-containing protein [Desulfuromonas sp. DDH964]AMV70963.1 ribosome-associated ATPase and membrane protein RbbA [Desulfuromonas sp. DDH964]
MTVPAVAIRQLSFAYLPGQPALAELSAAIEPGRVTGLVGPDGAGKTTLLRLLAGLLLPDAGTVELFGTGTRRETALPAGLIGYMPQKFGLYEELSVLQNLRLYADLQGVTGAEREAAFARLLEFTALTPFQGRRAGQLSGGMKQKLGLACALIRKPRLLLLDEPSVGVDPVSRRELWRMVRELVDPEMAVLWSTAYLDEAEKCDAVLLLNQGELLFAGPPGELTARVAGRSFQVQGIKGSRRQLLSRALQRPEVQDGIVQGQNVRLVLRPAVDPPTLAELGAGEGARLVAVEARFEDAFVDILGGGPGGESVLAASLAPAPASAGPTVEGEGLTKRFGDFTAVADVNFSIGRGEIFGLLGPNGAGKSTTFKMLCGLLKPSAGSGRVVGFDLQRAPGKARARLGYMAQKFSLYGDLTSRQNLLFFSGVYGLRGRKQQAMVTQMVDVFGLQPHLNDAAGELPLGFKQRLALACAVMHQPPVLFLDEPTSGVDPLTRREFWTHINGLVEKGVTVLVTTHFMDEAEYCDRIGLVYQGRIIASGSPDELKTRMRSSERPDPTLEDTFIALLEEWDAQQWEAV